MFVKARSPAVTSIVFGVLRVSGRYIGALLLLLQVNIKMLYFILHDNDNQWRFFNTGVRWLSLRIGKVLVTVNSVFSFIFLNLHFCKPYKRKFLQSSLDETKALMAF